MAIRELDPGQSHTFAEPITLRVELTGVAGQATLRPLDQAGGESAHIRLTPREVILTPQPRRVRLVVTPTAGNSFPAGTDIGLTLRTEGPSSSPEEILVSRVDLGALSSYELAVVEFAVNRVVLNVAGASSERIRGEETGERVYTSGQTFSDPLAHAALSPPADEHHVWLQPGRYAMRDAGQLAHFGRFDDPPSSWGLILDGSVSMQRLRATGELERLVGLVSGIMVEWTRRWATASVVAGVRVVEVSSVAAPPHALIDAAFNNSAPSSWAGTGAAAASVMRKLGGRGAVIVITDGAPGDLAQLTDVARANPDVQCTVVATGVSAAYGLTSDGQLAWWQEELAGLSSFAALPNTRVVAVQVRANGLLELSGDRAAEVALRLAQGAGVPA